MVKGACNLMVKGSARSIGRGALEKEGDQHVACEPQQSYQGEVDASVLGLEK